MHSYIRPNDYVVLRLPSDLSKVVKLVPNTTISLGKYGNFPASQIIGRPYYLTFEISEQPDEEDGHVLRIVPATELHAEALISEGSGEADGEGEELEMYSDNAPLRTNRDTIDDGSSQKLTLAEIEELKQKATGAGKEIISRLLESHAAIDQKTVFSLAKYKLRKQRKFLRRFTVNPMDVNTLTQFMLEEKDSPRILELRDELIGLLGCWGNVHHGGNSSLGEITASNPNGRYLIADETGGLVVAAMAERMGILYTYATDEEEEDNPPVQQINGLSQQLSEHVDELVESNSRQYLQRRNSGHKHPTTVSGNTLTLLHAHSQPNLSLLRYFGFDPSNPDPSHPLSTHLKTLSWLQLLDPSTDPIYAEEPETLDEATIQAMKPSRRGQYFRKHKRWARVRSTVDEARAGEFDGLIVVSLMEPPTILQHTVPLLAGSAPVVVYSPTIEPLTALVDLYSTARRVAFINKKQELEEKQERQSSEEEENYSDSQAADLSSEFPVNPTLLLGATLQTSRVRPWQVLPGRTHPLMSGRGGAEGYIFHAVRVVPRQERISARGKFGRKKRKIAATDTSTPVE